MKKTLVCLCVCLLVLLGACKARGFETKEENDQFEERVKRGAGQLGELALAGIRASNSLLKGAVLTASKSYDTREFKKIGDIKTALRDFYAVRPAYVQKIKLDNGDYARAGEVGDRTILFRTHGPTGQPTIELIKRDMNGIVTSPMVEKITYNTKPNF